MLRAGAEGRWQVHVKGGPAWSVKARAIPALRKTLIDAARAARLTQLAKLRGASGLKLTLRLTPPSASAGVKRPDGTVRVGEKLVMEVINKSDKKVYFALVEVGASASFAVFHPSGPLPAVLKPGRTFRLPSVFTAARPLGPYMYYVVASTDASPWWRKSRSMWGDGAGLLLGQALHNQPPAAAIYWDRAVWAVASTPLVIRAAR